MAMEWHVIVVGIYAYILTGFWLILIMSRIPNVRSNLEAEIHGEIEWGVSVYMALYGCYIWPIVIFGMLRRLR